MSSASTFVGLRPGVAQGTYPERSDERAPILSRTLRAAIGVLCVATASFFFVRNNGTRLKPVGAESVIFVLR